MASAPTTQIQLPDPNTDQEKYWLEVNKLLFSVNQVNEYTNLLNSPKGVLQGIENLLKSGAINVTRTFSAVIVSLSDLLEIDGLDIQVGLKIIEILIKLSEESISPLESISYVSIVCFLLTHCKNISKKSLVQLKKLCSKYLQKENVKTVCRMEKHKLLPCLKIAFSNLKFCTSDAGIQIVGSFVALDFEFITVFHQHILRQLMLCKREHAISFGKIYFQIWSQLTDGEQKLFEEQNIQWLMDRACTLGQSIAAQQRLSSNVQALLTGLHLSRKGVKFSKVVTELYEPILGKYLHSDNSVYRCNAAKIFFDVYPLERPREGEASYSKNLQKQHDDMLHLLDDLCPAIRALAIKGICLNIRYFWITFLNGTLEKVLKKFFSDLVLDGSSSSVRRAVYEGLTNILNCESSHGLLKNVLPLLKECIHDENQSVRRAFILMLLKIKELDGKIKYYNIVNIETVAARLANDTPKNRQLIVRLIASNFFREKLSLDESFSRVCKFIRVNPTASRYLARYSECELKFKTAVEFMCLILLKLMREIKNSVNKVEEASDASQLSFSFDVSDHQSRNTDRRSSRRFSISLLETSSSKRILDTSVSWGLIDFVSALWLIHGKTLQTEANKDSLENLYACSAKCLPLILLYFRGSQTYFSAVNVASLIPYSRLSESTTVAGACKTMLSNLPLESPANEYRCFIHALCSWNRGGDVIELAIDWIDEAFRSQSLNESAIRPIPRSGKRVKFTRSKTNPMIAMRVLDELFSSPTDQTIVFSKNVDDLRVLFEVVSRIKILIKSRINSGTHINDSALNDTFLVECLTMYGNLIIMFDENKVEDFNFWKTFDDYLNWCSTLFTEFGQNIGPVKEQTIDAFILDLLQVPLKQCVNVVALGKSRSAHERLVTLLKFVHSLLKSGYGLHFVEMSLHFVKHLLLYCKAYYDNFHGCDVMSVQFPEIMETLLNMLADEIPSKETFARFVKDSAGFKRNLTFIHLLSLKLYPNVKVQTNPCYKIMHTFCQCLVRVILFPIIECETLNIDEDLKNLPIIGRLMVAVFTCQLELGSALLYVLRTIIENYVGSDILKLLACTSLLYTFAYGENKIPKSDLLKMVKITHRKLGDLPTDENECIAIQINSKYTDNDRTIIEVEDTTERAVKEIGLYILAKIAGKLGGSLPGNTAVPVVPTSSSN